MKEEHLNEDQIIVSVVDEDDLPAGFKSHLKTCPLCQEERRVLMSRLDEMGATARDLAPRPKAGPLPDMVPGRLDSRLQDSRHRDPGHWQRLLFRWPVFASGLACFVIIAGIWGLMMLRGPQGKPQVPQVNIVAASGTPGQEQVAEMASIGGLSEESVLPESYLDIAGASSEDLGGGPQKEPQVPQVNIAASESPGQEEVVEMASMEGLSEESVLPESYLDITGASSEDLGGGSQEEPQMPQVNIAASESSGQEQVAGMASIEDRSEESVLPESYLDIAGASSEDFGDGFLEFVAPLEEPDDSA